MTSSNANGHESPTQGRLPRRDWILIPALSMLTIGSITATTELIARRLFYSADHLEDIAVLNDRSTGVRGIPNSATREKVSEGEPYEISLNSCGDFAGKDCGPKAPDTYRIVMVGTSFAIGLGVPREQTFAALLPIQLSRLTGRKVELYNEGFMFESPHSVALRSNKILAAKPDVILWILTAWDVKNASLVLPGDALLDEELPFASRKGTTALNEKGGVVAKAISQGMAFIRSLTGRAVQHWREMAANVMLNHLMIKFDDQRMYLKRSKIWHDDAQYLGAKPSPERLCHLQEFEGYYAEIQSRARSAGVPLVVVMIPFRAHAALISSGEWPADIDPFGFDDELRSIVTSHGGTYIDILPYYRAIPNPEGDYFPVNTHPNAKGHAMLSALLARQLTSGAIPALSVAAQPNARPEQEK